LCINNRKNFIVDFLKSDPEVCISESGSSPIDFAEEHKIRLESWLLAAGGKKKGRIYRVGDLAHNFKRVNTLTYNQPSTSFEDSPSVLLLKEEVQNYKEHNDKLTEHVKSLVSIILPFLPPEARSFIAQQSQQVLSPQEPPRQKEPPTQQRHDDNDYADY